MLLWCKCACCSGVGVHVALVYLVSCCLWCTWCHVALVYLVSCCLWCTWCHVASGVPGVMLPLVYLVSCCLWCTWCHVASGVPGVMLPLVYLVSCCLWCTWCHVASGCAHAFALWVGAWRLHPPIPPHYGWAWRLHPPIPPHTWPCRMIFPCCLVLSTVFGGMALFAAAVCYLLVCSVSHGSLPPMLPCYLPTNQTFPNLCDTCTNICMSNVVIHVCLAKYTHTHTHTTYTHMHTHTHTHIHTHTHTPHTHTTYTCRICH